MNPVGFGVSSVERDSRSVGKQYLKESTTPYGVEDRRWINDVYRHLIPNGIVIVSCSISGHILDNHSL
jgi:H2-forming N5,N10-methylenetetrahydromethanopterin dehydrogenase-like enzyme